MPLQQLGKQKNVISTLRKKKKGDTEDFQGIRTIDFTPNEIS